MFHHFFRKTSTINQLPAVKFESNACQHQRQDEWFQYHWEFLLCRHGKGLMLGTEPNIPGPVNGYHLLCPIKSRKGFLEVQQGMSQRDPTQTQKYCASALYHQTVYCEKIDLSIYLSIYLFIYPFIIIYIYLSIYPSIHLSIHPSIYPFII